MELRLTIALALMLPGCNAEEALGIPPPPSAEDTGDGDGDGDGTAAEGEPGSSGAPDGGEESSGDGADEGEPPSAAELYAMARCGAFASCTCPIAPFVDDGECLVAMEELFLAQQDRFATADTDFECFDAIVAFYGASACETTLEIAVGELAPACSLFADDGAADEACVRAGFTTLHADSCGAGLVCTGTIDGPRCRPEGDTSHLIAAGETCVGAAGIAGPCESGHWCDVAVSATCLARVDLGEPCSTHAACESGLCDSAVEPAVCADKRAPGSPCTNTVECAPPCTDEGCERALCADGECRQGVPQVCFTEDV